MARRGFQGQSVVVTGIFAERSPAQPPDCGPRAIAPEFGAYWRVCDFAHRISGRYWGGMTHAPLSLTLTPASALRVAFAGALLSTAGLSGAAQAQSAPDGVMQAEILPGWANTDGTRTVALRITLADGWKTYWRAPGDAGIPPHFTFDGSQNLASVEMLWPRPEIFQSAGQRTVGYHHELVLPIVVTPTDIGEPIRLETLIEMGICEEICVPVEVELLAEIAASAPQRQGKDPAILAALNAAPVTRNGIAQCTAEPIRDGMRVTARIDLPAPPDESAEDLASSALMALMATSPQAKTKPTPPAPPELEIALFELLDMPVWISESETYRRDDETLISIAEIVPDAAEPFPINFEALRLTVLSGENAYEITGCAG